MEGPLRINSKGPFVSCNSYITAQTRCGNDQSLRQTFTCRRDYVIKQIRLLNLFTGLYSLLQSEYGWK
jgi:hypothetical protein